MIGKNYEFDCEKTWPFEAPVPDNNEKLEFKQNIYVAGELVLSFPKGTKNKEVIKQASRFFVELEKKRKESGKGA
jgi:hypothetical protein